MASSQCTAYFYPNRAKLSPSKLQYTFSNVSNYENNCDIVHHNRKSLTELYHSSMLSVVTEQAKVCIIVLLRYFIIYCIIVADILVMTELILVMTEFKNCNCLTTQIINVLLRSLRSCCCLRWLCNICGHPV